MRFLVPLAFLSLAAPLMAADEVPFTPVRSFADAAACRAHLGTLVADGRLNKLDAAEGPYEIAAGDVRAHLVLAGGSGHRITEHRCLGAKLDSRSWRHSMEGDDEGAPETIETMAAKAPWLTKVER